ncbi:NADH dehydrogenase subunit L [Holospora obtusa F1]|uniref:NADH dehydrogenase subunit L n=1 Tax=Holospora obtusa F1 TaxID=1399147 RepID=W6TV03_HOLOB|nr:NADH dehydrogenase subunit L [Holospora obtusa]ETZ07602.1 NADH dehydrogenase subunit L [Holospora obtusa F1]
MFFSCIKDFFFFDILSVVMMSFITILGIIIYFFSKTYMKGEMLYDRFLLSILKLLFFNVLMSASDHLCLFLVSWIGCNKVLSQLMAHNSTWKAARVSGKLALNNFYFGFTLIMFSFFCCIKRMEVSRFNTLCILQIVHGL